MKIWKRNAVIATVLLFVCAGIYLNWSYNKGDGTPDLTETLDSDLLMGDSTLVSDTDDSALLTAAYESLDAVTSMDEYFAEVRLSRQESRDSAISTLQEAMAYETDGNDDAAVSNASAALEDVVATALAEAQIESLIIAKGYADCVAYMTDSGISIAVAAPEEGLDAAAVAQIADIVTAQSDYSIADIRVIPVK